MRDWQKSMRQFVHQIKPLKTTRGMRRKINITGKKYHIIGVSSTVRIKENTRHKYNQKEIRHQQSKCRKRSGGSNHFPQYQSADD